MENREPVNVEGKHTHKHTHTLLDGEPEQTHPTEHEFELRDRSSDTQGRERHPERQDDPL